jgi:parallel beta-helix repeat protein
MNQKTVSAITLTLLLTSMLTLAFNIQPVKAEGTIYIRPDGSIDPPTVPIQRNGDIYTMTEDIETASDTDGIIAEKSDIVIDGAGHTLYSYRGRHGVALSDIGNVLIRNMRIVNFYIGIYLNISSNNHVTRNLIAESGGSGIGIELDSSFENDISDNDVICQYGIELHSSYNNVVLGNNLTRSYKGIYLFESSNNNLTGNFIAPYSVYCLGISLVRSSNNIIVGNEFVDTGLWVDSSYGTIASGNLVNGKALVYLEGSSDLVVADAGQVLLINCNRITVENLNLSSTHCCVDLQNTNSTRIIGNKMTKSTIAIRLYMSFDNIVLDNDVSNNEPSTNECGILVESSFGNSILGNRIRESADGIRLSESSNNTVSYNNLTENGSGIWITSSSNNSISYNHVANKYIGLFFARSSNNVVSHNSFTGHNDYGIELYSSHANAMVGNNVTANRAGLHFKWSLNNTVLCNIIVNNDGAGVFLEFSSNNTISSNKIASDSQWANGIILSGFDNYICGNSFIGIRQFSIQLDSSSGNIIYHNNFISCTARPYSRNSTSVWDDSYPSGGNYWSDYEDVDEKSGSDQNQAGSDGIWDHPYVFDQYSQDRYPLTKPYVPFWDLVSTYFPHLVFDEEEKFYPTSFFHDDADITNNPTGYNSSWPLAVYVNTIECHSDVDNKDYICLQYWFYYAKDSGKVVVPKTPWTNETTFWPHPHDWESVFVFLEIQGTDYVPKQITYFHHVEIWVDLDTLTPTYRDCYNVMNWQNPMSEPEKVNGTHALVHVARHSHASYPHTVFDYAIHLTTIGIEPGGEVADGIPCPIEPCNNGTEVDYDDFQMIYVNETTSWPDQFDTVEAPWNRTRWDEPENLLYPSVIRNQLTVLGLHESGSKLYLHIYDNQSRHVGKNYLTDETETEIQDSYYEDLGNTTFIILPGDNTNFTIMVDAMYAEKDLEDYQIIVTTYRGNDYIDECNLTKTISKEERQEFNVELSEDGDILIIPEFKSLIILPLFILSTLLAVIAHRKRGVKNRKTNSDDAT